MLLATVAHVGLLFGDSGSTRVQVSAYVIARAVVSYDKPFPEVLVSAADIERGYIDLAEPIVLRVRTNSRNGYLLQVTKSADAFSSVELSFADATMRVTLESWIARPYVAGGETVSARARLFLSPAVAVGRYSLPIAITANPL